MTRLFIFHFVFILTACPRRSLADEFTFPPQNGGTGEYISNLAFTAGQSIDIKWQSGCDESIHLWLMKDFDGGDCQFQRDTRCSQIADTPNNGSIEWNVSFMGLSGSGVYYLYAFCGDQTSTSFSSHYFNISSKRVPITTTSPETTTSIPTSTKQSSLLDATTSASPGPTSGTAKSTTPVGAIVGGVIGGLLIIGLTVIVGMVFLRKRAPPSHPSGSLPQTWGGKPELPCPDSIPGAIDHEDHEQQSSRKLPGAPIELPS